MENFTSRKLIVSIIGFVVGIVLSYFGKLDTVTSNFIIYMTGAYIIGNNLESFSQAYKDRNK